LNSNVATKSITSVTDKTYKILEKENKYMSYTTRVPYYPLVVDKAKGSIVTDIEGNEFIDFLSSAAVINTGHNHPKVIKAINDQVKKFVHYTPAYMYHEPHTNLAEKLIEITPGNFKKRVAFGLSGSSSVDGAIKAARCYTGRTKIISFLRSYHGTTYGALSVSGYGVEMRRKMNPLVPDVEFIPYPDCYRCINNQKFPGCDLTCFRYFENLLETVLPKEEIAAVIFEPIQGDAGIITPPQKYYEKLVSLCRKNNILLIADEVQTGFGRTGKMFACEHFGLEPDIIVMGKAIASGMPLSAIVARSEIFESWNAPVHFFNTAGNVISCSAAIATIDVIKEDELISNANVQGNYIIDRFKPLMDKFDCIGDVRGKGLLIGVDIVKDRDTKERDINKTAKICWRCWEKGLILAFFSGSVLRIAPPLTLSSQEAERAMDIIEEAISDVEEGLIPDEVLEQIKGW
jgi:4-aminobutyrate aminotransferase